MTARRAVIDANAPVTLEQAGDAAAFGGKAANLARLAAAGARTAPAVVLPAAALDAHLAVAGLPPAAGIHASLLALDAQGARLAAAELREHIERTPIEPRLVASLREALPGAPQDRSAPVAVRSSAIGEDGADASFAGVFDTRLGVHGPQELATAVRAVWASLVGDRALAYARHRGHLPRGMAVILQAQVDAAVSGVLFTRDPRGAAAGADRAMIVECCAGPGDRLVGGEVTPARLRIERADGAFGIEEEGDDRVVPSAAQVRALCALGARLEQAFGAPQDVEWSIDRAGALVVLQSRPITGPGDAHPRPRIAWSNANIAENFPDPVSPMLRSFVGLGYAAYFRGLGEAFGISRRRIDAMADALEHLVGTHAGRLYYNLTNVHAVLHLAPGGRHLARFFNTFTGADGFPDPPRIGAPAIARVVEALRIAVRVPWHYLTVERRLRRFESTVDAYAAATVPRGLGDAGAPALASHLRGFLDIRTRRWTDAALADTAAMVCYGVLQALVGRWLRRHDQAALQNDLLKGLPGLASAMPVEALWSLSRRVRETPALAALAADGSPESFAAALHSPECAALRESLDDYFERWGFRYSGELMLVHPTPQEDPLPVMRMLRSFAREDGAGPAEASARQARARAATTAAVCAELTPFAPLRALPLGGRAGVFRAVLHATQGAIRLRERARMKQALLYTRLRHVALALGDRLVGRELLERRDDVFLLTIQEAIALAEGDALLPTALPATVAARRQALAAFAPLSPPDAMVLPRGEQWTPGSVGAPGAVGAASDQRSAGATGAATCASGVRAPMRGSAACGGTAQGPAAVILDVVDADRIRPGDVLVTRQTDPGWASVFFLIRGLVIERGGMLSHGAIIAREYGIPAVVGVRDATRLIPDGAQVKVNGDLGLVEFHRA